MSFFSRAIVGAAVVWCGFGGSLSLCIEAARNAGSGKSQLSSLSAAKNSTNVWPLKMRDACKLHTEPWPFFALLMTTCSTEEYEIP